MGQQAPSPAADGQDVQSLSAPAAGLTARAVAIALLLIPVNVVFMLHGYMWGQSRPATVSLIFNAVISLAAVVIFSRLASLIARRPLLSPAELAVIYAMVTLACAVSGLDQVQTAVPVVAHPIWFATPENRWEDLFLRDMPKWLTVEDTKALWAMYDSHLPLFATPYWRPWLRVTAVWSGFWLLMLWVMLCLNTIVRRNWMEESKLSFPIVQIPIAIAEPAARVARSYAFWIGFGVALIIDILNGLHRLYPAVPSLMGVLEARFDLGQQLKSMPWRAIGWTPLTFYPFAIGLAFFIPLDLAFSCWFFYVYWKIVRIVSAALGWGRIPRAPWIDEQSHGAYQALAGYAVWASRRQFAAALRAMFGRFGDDPGEPLPMWLAGWGAVLGTAGLILFCMAAGVPAGIAAAFWLLYWGISLAVTRIRAELGSPVHDLHKVGPEVIITEAIGPRYLSRRTLIFFAYAWSFNRAHRSHPMPHMLEPMKMAEQLGAGQRAIAIALIIAAIVAVPLSWIVMIDAMCRYGGLRRSGKGREAFTRLQNWLVSEGRPNWYSVGAVAVGAATTVLLAAARIRWTWWPFHPAGFAVSGSWSMALFAPSIFISWFLKSLILRYGGLSAYPRASRFFIGLVMGEFLAGTFWGTLGILKRRPMYNFLP